MLEDKGFVGHEQFGKTYRYHAIVNEEEFSNRTLKSVVKKYFNNSYLGVVSSLIEEKEISVDELKKLIEQVENVNRK